MNARQTQPGVANRQGGPHSAYPRSLQTQAQADAEATVLTLAFAPMHKRAFGLAIGVTASLGIFLLTAFHVIVQPIEAPDLHLLAQYFYGYEVSWRGAFIGAGWAFLAGFVAGWFAAFCRNLAIAISVFVTRTRADLIRTRDFLDHI